MYGGHGGANVACLSFLKWTGFESTVKVNVQANWNEDESMLELEMPAEAYREEKRSQVVSMEAGKKKATK
jgi:hypothetical protein